MARPERFELPTPRFVVWCSIQLSYGRPVGAGAGTVAGRRGLQGGRTLLKLPGLGKHGGAVANGVAGFDL